MARHGRQLTVLGSILVGFCGFSIYKSILAAGNCSGTAEWWARTAGSITTFVYKWDKLYWSAQQDNNCFTE
jgi:hypothetical protein